MAHSSKPAVVLVHGIWHSPLTYSKFTTALLHAGYDVFCPFLPSCSGFRPPIVHANEDIQVVRRLVEMLADQDRSIIMVLHSYGGVVGCDAIAGLDAKSRLAAGKKGGVVHLIGLAAHFYTKGFAILDIVREFKDDHLIPLAFDIADDGSCLSADPVPILFNDVPKDEADSLALTLSRAPLDVMEHKVQHEAWRYVPVTYVRSSQDTTLPVHYQQRILEKLEKAGSPPTVVTLEAGHSMYVSKTEDVVKIVENVASKAIG